MFPTFCLHKQGNTFFFNLSIFIQRSVPLFILLIFRFSNIKNEILTTSQFGNKSSLFSQKLLTKWKIFLFSVLSPSPKLPCLLVHFFNYLLSSRFFEKVESCKKIQKFNYFIEVYLLHGQNSKKALKSNQRLSGIIFLQNLFYNLFVSYFKNFLNLIK